MKVYKYVYSEEARSRDTGNEMIITPIQCKAARLELGWTQVVLGKKANVGESTIRDFEAGRRVPSRNNLAVIALALENGGTSFARGSEPSVQLQKAQRNNSQPPGSTGNV